MGLAAHVSADAENQISLQELDAVVARHPNLESFLNDKNAIEKYFETLSAYMGPEKMKRDNFNAILNQLQDLSQKSPLLSQRLWETTGTGAPFSVQSSTVSYGRALGSDWDPESLLKNARGNPLGPPLGNVERDTEILRLTNIVETSERSLNLEGLNRSQRQQAQARHFENLRSSEQVRILSEHYAHAILTSEDTKALLRSGDPDLIFETVKSMNSNPRAFLPRGMQIPGSVVSEIKKRLPDFQALLRNTESFPEVERQTRKGSVILGKSRPGQYDFTPVPRRFHGIWKGIPNGECVGGGCSVKVSARRWATVALKDSQLYFLEKNGRYSGFIEAIPGKIGEKTFVSLGFGAPDLRKIIYSQGPSGDRVQTTLFRRFLDEARPRLPENWGGFVLSASTDINNAGVASTSHSSVAFNWGEKVSSTESFKLLDPLIQDISAFTPAGEYSSPRGVMIIDALTPRGEKDLRVLSSLPEAMLRDPNAVIEFLKSADFTTGQNVINAIKNDSEFVKKIRPGLEDFVSRIPGSFAEGSPAILYLEGGVNLDNEKLVGTLLRGLEGKRFTDLMSLLDHRHASALRSIPLNFRYNQQKKEILALAALLKLDPELKDPLNKAWVNKLITRVAQSGDSKILQEVIEFPGMRSEVLKNYPHLVEHRNAIELLGWIRLHPEELNYSFMRHFRSTNPGTRELRAFSKIVSEAVLRRPEDLVEIMEAVSDHSLDGPEARSFKDTVRGMLLGQDKKSIEAVSEALAMNIRFAEDHFKPEMVKIANGTRDHPGWRNIVSGYLEVEVDGKDTALIKNILAANDEELTWKILTKIKGPLSAETWEILRKLKPPVGSVHVEVVEMIRRLDPNFEIPENEKFMRNLLSAQLELNVQENQISLLVNQGLDKRSSQILGEEIVRLKKYDLFFGLGDIISNASDVHGPIIRAAGDVEFSEALIRHIQKAKPGESNHTIQQVRIWEDQIRRHPTTWSNVVIGLKRDYPDIGAHVEDTLAKIPALQGTGRCTSSVTEALNILLAP